MGEYYNLQGQSAVVKLPQKVTKELYHLSKNFQKHDYVYQQRDETAVKIMTQYKWACRDMD